MPKPILYAALAAVAVLLCATPALADFWHTESDSAIFTFSNCASGGSASQTVTAGRYLLVVADEGAYVCKAATCATGGRYVPSNVPILIKFGKDQTVSCRSSGSSADVQFQAGDVVTQ